MRMTESYPRTRLESAAVREIIKAAAERGFVSLSITGGEPFLYEDEVLALLKYAREQGIRYTRSGTNGFMFCCNGSPESIERRQARVARLATKLRDAGLYTFWISLDSADPAVHERARGLNGVVEGIRRALPILHENGVYPCANLAVNRSMGRRPIRPLSDPDRFAEEVAVGLADFFEAVIDLGFTMANLCYPMSLEPSTLAPAYRAISSDQVVGFSRQERAILYRVLACVISRFRSRIRIFSPLVSLGSLAEQHAGRTEGAAPCRGGYDFVYVSAADGCLYPCGYRGAEPLGRAVSAADWRQEGAPSCRLCDWECFRDPSELAAPFVHSARGPRRFLQWIGSEAAATWWTDLSYYRACDYFSLRKPPREAKLRRFSP
jgi:hypothetical protein